jgi:hypothetical protein
MRVVLAYSSILVILASITSVSLIWYGNKSVYNLIAQTDGNSPAELRTIEIPEQISADATISTSILAGRTNAEQGSEIIYTTSSVAEGKLSDVVEHAHGASITATQPAKAEVQDSEETVYNKTTAAEKEIANRALRPTVFYNIFLPQYNFGRAYGIIQEQFEQLAGSYAQLLRVPRMCRHKFFTQQLALQPTIRS